ncbi:MAG TPA: AAA family ATPase, partial [Deltaproteobacteria bacterium]|nr:AAA family ATPase [Deltaproteobacteria bacterium]
IGGGHDEREQTLNQMLVEMDGFTENEGIIVMAATNRPDVLDPALLRPGRFDRRIAVELPDIKGRKEILDVHSKNIKISGNADLSIIAKSTPGFSGADLQNLINEAALHAASLNKESVKMEDLEFAKEKVMMGPERKSMVLSEDEKRLTAIHESGHTLIAKLLPNADPVYKVTIIPRGRAMGLTQQIPEFDRHSYSKEYLQSRLMVLLGGRAAEEVTGNSITTGAANDISQATKLATSMVAEWGMSKLGPIHYSEDEKNPFLGQELTRTKIISDKTAENIDSEISFIINDAYGEVIKLLNDNLHKLKQLTDNLSEKETLTASQIDEIVKK